MRLVLAALAFAMFISGCAGSDETTGDAARFPDGAISVVANADIAIGPSRLIVAVAGSDGRRLGSPDDVIALEVAPADQPELRQRADGVFVWIIEDAFGLYRTEFDFDRPGVWSVTVVPREGRPLEPSFFAVNEDTAAPGVGDSAPLVPTPTASDSAIADITTDPEPDARFYELSLDAAARSGATTVAVFSTPAFCRTATCGPLLDQTKKLAPEYPEVNFIHVEIYAGFNEPGFVPDGNHLAPPVTEEGWSLPSEPWVFVINGAGVVTHRFEGVMDPDELRAALA